VGHVVTIDWSYVESFSKQHLLPFGLSIAFALLVFIAGRFISRSLVRLFDKVMERSHVDVSLRKFLGDVAYAVLSVVVVIAALDTVGIKTTAVVAVLGAAGLAIGLALQGSLSNFAAGVMLIVLRPYKVGDLVTIGKYLGRVDAIRVFQTILITADNREITIPNGQIIAAPIENMTILGRRRIDLVVTVGHPVDLPHVRELLASALASDGRFEHSSVQVAEITDGNVKLFLRPWTQHDDYTEISAAAMERIKNAMEHASLKYSIALQVPT
jgi:small conductance mechanosensitive channel